VPVTRPFCCRSCFALLLPSSSSLPAFLIRYVAILCPIGFLPGRLLVLIHSQFPRRPERTRQYILARSRQANMRVPHPSPAARNRQESPGRLLHKRRLLVQR